MCTPLSLSLSPEVGPLLHFLPSLSKESLRRERGQPNKIEFVAFGHVNTGGPPSLSPSPSSKQPHEEREERGPKPRPRSLGIDTNWRGGGAPSGFWIWGEDTSHFLIERRESGERAFFAPFFSFPFEGKKGEISMTLGISDAERRSSRQERERVLCLIHSTAAALLIPKVDHATTIQTSQTPRVCTKDEDEDDVRVPHGPEMRGGTGAKQRVGRGGGGGCQRHGHGMTRLLSVTGSYLGGGGPNLRGPKFAGKGGIWGGEETETDGGINQREREERRGKGILRQWRAAFAFFHRMCRREEGKEGNACKLRREDTGQ